LKLMLNYSNGSFWLIFCSDLAHGLAFETF
jgi:hypothetical protein